MAEKPYTLQEHFAGVRKQELEAKAQQAQQAKETPSWIVSRLPPSDPLVKRRNWEHFNPGVPYPDEKAGA